MGRRARPLILAVTVVGSMLMPWDAVAACHIAAFEEASRSVPVNEAAGHVTLTVELIGGQPTCSGTVDYRTINGSAVAGQDYTARQGTLSFTAFEERKKSFQVPILNDSADEPSQGFTVQLSNGTEDLTADGTPASVTIIDNDVAAQSPKASPKASAPSTPSSSPTAKATPLSSPTLTASASPTPDVTTSASPTIAAAPAATSSSGRGWLLGGLGAVLAAAGIATTLWLRRSRP